MPWSGRTLLWAGALNTAAQRYRSMIRFQSNPAMF